MPYTVEVFPDEGYVSLEHRGTITLNEISEARNKVIEQVANHQISNVLVSVLGVTNKLSTFEAYFVTEEHGKVKRPAMRGALLARPDQMDDVKFVETVARNRGMNIWAFDNKEDALAWLRV